MEDYKKYATTFEQVWAAMAKTDKQIAESNARMDRTDKKMAKDSAKFEKQMVEFAARMDKNLAELKETRKEVGGLSKSYGMHAESYFFQSLKKSKQFGGIIYDCVDNDIKSSLRLPNREMIDAQFDIVMSNGDCVAIIEIKNRVQKDDVKNLVNKKLNDFKNLFLQYSNYKIYLGIAGFAYDKNAEEEALNTGVGILKLSGDNVEILDEHLKVY